MAKIGASSNTAIVEATFLAPSRREGLVWTRSGRGVPACCGISPGFSSCSVITMLKYSVPKLNMHGKNSAFCRHLPCRGIIVSSNKCKALVHVACPHRNWQKIKDHGAGGDIPHAGIRGVFAQCTGGIVYRAGFSNQRPERGPRCHRKPHCRHAEHRGAEYLRQTG